MKVGFKRALIGLVALLVLTLGALAIFLLTFDPNAYKDKFQEFVYDRYQRTLSIEGNIELSLFPRIGLSVQNVSLSNPGAADERFASIDSARFAVAIWPLLSDRFVVDHVSISGFKAWIRRDEQGQYNFRDLLEGGSDPIESSQAVGSSGFLKSAVAQPAAQNNAKPAAQRKEAAFHVDIAGLELKDGEIHYLDVKREQAARLVNLQLNTGRMTFDQPFDVSMRGNLRGDDPQADATVEGQALVKIDPAFEIYSAQKLNLVVSGLVGPLDAKTATLRGNFAYDGYSRMLDASAVEMQVQGAVQGEQPVHDLGASLTMPRLKVDQTRSEFKIEKMAFRAKGGLPDQTFDVAFDAPSLSISPETAEGEAVAGTVKLEGRQTLGLTLGMKGLGGNAWNLSLKELKVEGSLKGGDSLMQVNLLTPVQWDVINKKGTLSAIKGDVAIQGTEEPVNSFEFPLIGSLHADLIKDEVSSDINAVLNGAPLNFKLNATELANPKLRFALQADMLDFDKLLPVSKPAAEQPAPRPEQDAQAQPEQSEQPAEGTTSEAVPQEKAQAEPPKPIDLAVLNDIDVAGTVKLGGLNARGLEASNVNMSIAAGNGKLTVDGISANLYEGSLTGALTANAQNQFTGNLSLKQVSFGPLLRAISGSDSLSGSGNVAVKLNSHGATAAALKAGLGGTATLLVRNGAVRGIDLNQTLSRVGGVLQSVLDGRTPDLNIGFDLGNRTQFDALDASLAIKNGVADIQKLDFRTPLLRVTQGKPASIDLVKSQLNVHANVRVVKTSGQGTVDLSVLRGMTVPVHVAGAFNALQFRVLWDQMGGSIVKNAIQRGLLDFIDGRTNEGPAQAPAQPKVAPPSEEAIKEGLGKALKGLLGG